MNLDEHQVKNEHEALVKIIRDTHTKLRRSFFFSRDSNKVWQDHITEKDLRKSYSTAMLKLATEVWGHKECRIEWSYKTSLDYFFNGGMEKYISKERIFQQHNPHKTKISIPPHEVCCTIKDFTNANKKLNLLDVGSCYNPFKKFSEFSCVAIDLTPATEDVLQCDFLNMEISKYDDVIEDNSGLTFYEESFDIVVLSLVLEYLPAPQQRAVFCFKAWKLLKKYGLCIIITPDSKTSYRNANMMKSWKIALETIGYKRIKYEKLTHMHCMAFRKTSATSEITITNCQSLSNLLYIPQDFKTYETESSIERTDEENYAMCEHFSELPNVCTS